MAIIPEWFPKHPPLYDIAKSYRDNAEQGPFFTGTIPERTLPPPKDWVDFLGHNVASRIGVPAGPLLNSRWTTLAGKLGFDIVTYKTIRTSEHAGHPAPNMIYVDLHGETDIQKISGPVNQTLITPSTMSALAVTNSFGMPSYSPEFLHTDIADAQKNLGAGQVLIVSVVGTPRPGENFTTDFVQAALLAKSAGAKIIEANFSCPNVCSGEGSIYTNPETVFDISHKIVAALKDIPLIIKVGAYADTDLMKKVFVAAARAGVRAIAGINTVGKKVVTALGNPALGPGRETSGICGAPIRDTALNFVKNARTIIDTERLGITLIGGGGIVLPEHFDAFFSAGADFAVTATGMMWDPYLALRYHQS